MIRISAVLVLLSIAAALVIAACSVILGQGDPCYRAVNEIPTDTLVEFEGHFVASFEVSSFVPCGCSSDPGYGGAIGSRAILSPVSRRHMSYPHRLRMSQPLAA